MSVSLSDNEEKAVEFIESADTAYQSELWKELDVTSRTGSRIAKRLEEKGVIERERTTHEGNKTYELHIAGEADDEEPEEPQASAEELDEDERRALNLVRSTGGIFQSELWKELDVSSRQGSRISKKLADSGFIEREQEVHEGNRTYYLTPLVERLDYSLLVAGNMISPFVGEEQPDHLSGSFTEWVYELAHDQEE